MSDIDIYTGDEIHFTDGTIWSCTFRSSYEDMVVFVACGFKDISNYCGEIFWPEDVKPLIIDAIHGGAKIVKGVGLEK